MKKNLKIDPYIYPIIIITAFVIGFALALALGFGPQHGNQGSAGHGTVLSTMLQLIPM